MGNLSTKRHVIQSKVRQNLVNNNAYNFRNDQSFTPQFTSMDSTLWPKPNRPQEVLSFEPSPPISVTEVSDFLGKPTTLVDLSDTSTLTVSSDEISSRSSSDTLHPTKTSIRNQACNEEKQGCRSNCGDAGDKSIANSDYLNLESLSTPSGCSHFQPKQLSGAFEDSLVTDVTHKPPIRKEIKPPAQPKPIPPPCASRQPISNFKNARSVSRQSITPGLKPGRPNSGASDRKLPDRQPQQPSEVSLRSSQPLVRTAAPNKPSQSVPRHIRQIENHNSQQAHYQADSSFRSFANPLFNNECRNSNFANNASRFKNVSRSNMSINVLSASPYPRHSCLKGLKNSSNLVPALLSPKDSSQSYVRSCASNPKSRKENLRSPITSKSPKVERGRRTLRTHGLRKISDSEYQRYNAIINDFHYYMKSRKKTEQRGPPSSNSRSSSIESKMSSIDNLKSKAYDETDDEIYSFPLSTTLVRSPSQMERSQSVGSFGDSRHDLSLCSNNIKSAITLSGRTLKHSTNDPRSNSQQNSARSYIVEIDRNINVLKRQPKDPKAIFCYKFLVNDGLFMQKMLTDSKDHRIETICRQTFCRIHVKRRWLRHCSKPPCYDIIIFARELKNIERCCNLFNIMFPSFNADAGLGY